MSNSIKRTYTRHFLPLMKLLAVTMVIVAFSYALYNAFLLKQLSKGIVSDFNQIYSISRRFAQYYNNTDTTFLTKGTHVRNGVSIMVSKDTDVKVLSTGINKLRAQLETIAPDHVWTVAIFEHPATYGHFDPLRQPYAQRYSQYKANDVMTRIVDTERLENTFDQFYGCNIKLSEPYPEPGTNELVRTVYYPVYNERKLDALLAVDIKNSFIDYKIAQFNREFFTTADTMEHWFSFRVPVEISCTDANTVYVGFGAQEIFERILIPSILIALFGHMLRVIYLHNKQRLYTDRMTGFYRRDFYEPRLKKLQKISMLIIDIDFFKSINDTFGHKMGDDVITEVTRRIAKQIRASDVAIRWGGEEFIILFKHMDEAVLIEKAEAIRRCVVEQKIADLNVTISIGGVHLEKGTFAQAYRIADKALYTSKENGRNQVTI
ncbi:diguanylate cyclase [Vibrio ponticus]|uniref:diguanylate cyclase n=1 Tax=Vibrio ponticus TaxID=265668 RepID=A0ABX3F9T2_9VIBR|nr:GGDEF domain-containing protein [Vibrio ponticus]OLQ87747.1 diguanylate cyclase [Vibrio ponticus]